MASLLLPRDFCAIFLVLCGAYAAFESRSSINEPSCSKILTPRSGDDPANYFTDETETLDHHRNLFAFPLVEFTSRYLPEQDRRGDIS